MQPTNVLAEKVRTWLQGSRRPLSSRDVYELTAAIGTDIGSVRDENQDRAVLARFSFPGRIPQSFTVAILCDGIGGSANGGASAEIAVAEVLASLAANTKESPTEQVSRAAVAANLGVHSHFHGNGGTTLVMLLMAKDACVAASVGDSRIYGFKQGKLVQITTDDTIAGEVSRLNGNSLSKESLDALSNSLVQFVGMGDGMEARMYSLAAAAGDWFVLTSDGAHRIFGSVVHSMFLNTPSKSQFLNRLLSLARWTGGPDNASVICISPEHLYTANLPSTSSSSIELWDSSGKLELFAFSFSSSIPSLLSPVPAQQSFNRAKKQPRRIRDGSVRSKQEHTEIPIVKEGPNKQTSQRTLQIELSDLPVPLPEPDLNKPRQALEVQRGPESTPEAPIVRDSHPQASPRGSSEPDSHKRDTQYSELKDLQSEAPQAMAVETIDDKTLVPPTNDEASN